MQALIDKETSAWLGIIGDEATPMFDVTLHDRIDVIPGWPLTIRWRAAGSDGPGFYPIEAVKLFTFNQWVDLFPLAEQVAIVTATMSDPLAKLIYDRAQSASGSIDPTDSRTVEGLGYLVSKGYVSAATFERITNAPAS